MKKIILVAGATGNLGKQITQALLDLGAEVRTIVRSASDPEQVAALNQMGAQVISLDFEDAEALTNACKGVSCVVSALSGLRDTIIDTQQLLLDAAVAAGVPRFIPSDYSLDFTKFHAGENRNLDWRREFHARLDEAPIAATTIFNGAFMDMLTGQMPLILFAQHKILCWGDPDHLLGFTTVQNTAQYTAHAALDPNTPRYLRIAGDQQSPKGILQIMTTLTGKPFKLFRPGGSRLLGFIIKIARTLSPGKNELYPAWQGMQYMHNMIDDRSNMDKTDNARYPEMKWTTVTDLLRKHLNATSGTAALEVPAPA